MSKATYKYDEESLVHLLKKKDQQGMNYLYENYSKVIYGIILNGVKRTDVAEDILQEVFIKIWKNIETYNPEKGRLYTWILNISRNSVIDFLRSKQNQKYLKNQTIENSVNHINNKENIEQKTDSIGLKKLVESLSIRHKEVIDMVYFKGYTQDETSKELNIPLGTVKTRVRSAILNLRTIFLEQ